MLPPLILTLLLLAVAFTALVGRRTGIASPLILVALGIAVGYLPFVPALEVEPEWVLAGILPPLLYSAAVSMPVTSFRRDLAAISGLSVTLVVVTSVAVGAFVAWVVPDLTIGWGIAIGVVLSPTDAVATSIARRVGVPNRVLALLEGESLLNDATALVLLRSAVGAAGASIAWGLVTLDFVKAVVIAVAIGALVGWLNLRLRGRIEDPAVSTALSFAAPFVASLPAEELGASGLVAAVVAGLVVGQGAPKRLSPRVRLSDNANWRTVELVLEGAIFLAMGLQLEGLIADARADGDSPAVVVVAAVGALLLTLVVRTAYVVLLLFGNRRRTARNAEKARRLEQLEERFRSRWDARSSAPGGRRRGPSRGRTDEERAQLHAERVEGPLEEFRTRARRFRADLDYMLSERLGRPEGIVLVWAGMRGAVSLAAAQTLPEDTPSRPLLVLVAFGVAFGSLVIQGATLPLIARRNTRPVTAEEEAEAQEDRERLMELMRSVRADTEAEHEGESAKAVKLAALRAQRDALLSARDEGVFDPEMLGHVMAVVDAEEIGTDLAGGPEG